MAQFAEAKSGNAGGYSFIGIYGWLQNPCVEYYITDDSYGGLSTSGTKATVDGATYYLDQDNDDWNRGGQRLQR